MHRMALAIGFLAGLIAPAYVVVWERVGSNWKLAIDIWNDGE